VAAVEPNSAVDAFTDALSRVVRLTALPRLAEQVEARAGTPLDRSGYVLLVTLLDQPHRIGDLAEILSLDVSTVSRQVQALESAGLVRREPHPTDGRSSLLAISDIGTVVVEAHRRARRSLFAEVLEDVPVDDLWSAAEILRGVAQRLADRAGS